MRTLVVRQNGHFLLDLAPEAIAATLEERNTVLWLDISDPTAEDQILLRQQFGFHPLAIEDATRSHERPKVDAYGVPGDEDGGDAPDDPPAAPPAPAADGATPAAGAGQDEDSLGESVLIPLRTLSAAPEERTRRPSYYFVVFHAAMYNAGDDHIETHPIGIFIGSNYLVTIHGGAVYHVNDTLARWRAPLSPLGNRIGALVHALLDALVDDYFPLMDQVADRVEDLEDTIFAHFDESAIETMFRLKKDLLAMRRIIAPERDVLNVLLRRQLPIFSHEDVAYLQDVYDHIVRVTDNIDTYRDLLSTALDSYLSLQSNKLNQIMKTLTVASIILMTAALITGFYGQNFHFFPDLAIRLGSFWSLILMAFATIILVFYFRRKRWL